MSIFAALSIGRLGLTAQSRALQVTANNISNVNTPGFTRQRAVFEPISNGVLSSGFSPGSGVIVPTAERISDATLEAQRQFERQQLGMDEGMERGLSRIEGIFEELGGEGINTTLSRFFAGLNDLANDPGNTAVRDTVARAAETLISQISDTDQRLNQLQLDENTKIRQSVIEVSDISRDIASLNRQIFLKETGDGQATASGLRDRRNELLNQLAEEIDYTSFERDDGSIAVFAAGGFLLVVGDESASLEVQTGGFGNPLFFDVFQNLGGSVNGPITSRISSGQIGASLALRDDRVQAYRNSLDEFAFSLADRINSVHYQPGTPPGALGMGDATSRRMFIDARQPVVAEGAAPVQVAGLAGALRLHPDIVANSRHIATGAGPSGGGPALKDDNRIVLALANVETLDTAFYAVGDTAGSPTGSPATLGAFMDSLSGSLGSELQSARRSVSQSELIVAELDDRRGALSGVSLDEEVANLVRYERAYQASARTISTMDELLQDLLAL